MKDRLETKYAEAADKDAKVEAGLQAAYETVLYARAYVTVDETTTLAESADTGRSIKGVAAYLTDDSPNAVLHFKKAQELGAKTINVKFAQDYLDKIE